jgi:predicted nucleic acid-binding protein
MMVLDASCAVALALGDEDAPADLRGSDLVGALAPTMWPYEVLSAIRNAERRGRLDEGAADHVSALLAELPLEFVHPDYTSVLAVARATDLSIYDASYVALALAHDVPLFTLDRKLGSAAASVGVHVLP